jgi:hypothetical protein
MNFQEASGLFYADTGVAFDPANSGTLLVDQTRHRVYAAVCGSGLAQTCGTGIEVFDTTTWKTLQVGSIYTQFSSDLNAGQGWPWRLEEISPQLGRARGRQHLCARERARVCSVAASSLDSGARGAEAGL